MTAIVEEANSGDADFFSADKKGIEDVPLACDTDVSADSTDESNEKPKKQDEKEEETKQGVFGRLFRRNRKQEPTIQNGAADLLDDERPVDEGGAGDDETAEEDEEEDEEEEEEEDEDENPNNSQQDDCDAFADFAQSTSNRYHEETDEEEDEMMSLISGPRTSGGGQEQTASRNSGGKRLGGLTNFLRRQRERRQNTAEDHEDKEKQSLLHGDYETDEDVEEFDEDDAEKQNQGLVRSSSGDYYDAKDAGSDYDEEDLRSVEGEYRLESFYPGGYQDMTSSQPNGQDMQGRIRGFGSESALGYNHNSMDSSYNASMNYMDVGDERRGILSGVGKAVSNIRQIIIEKRTNVRDEEERRRMLQYISQLENKLVEREMELQSWKERAEQLEKEVEWAKQNKEKEEVAEEEEEEEEGEEEDEFESDCENDTQADEAKELALIVFEGGAEDVNEETSGEQQEGTLIDMTPTEPVFDPLEGNEKEGADQNMNDNLMDTSHYQQPGDQKDKEMEEKDQTSAFFEQMESKANIKKGSGEQPDDALEAGAKATDTLAEF